MLHFSVYRTRRGLAYPACMGRTVDASSWPRNVEFPIRGTLDPLQPESPLRRGLALASLSAGSLVKSRSSPNVSRKTPTKR